MVIIIPIRIFTHAGFGNNLGLWSYEIHYFPEHGNKGNDIWNSDEQEIKNTTLIQMQFKAILEAFLYLNTLTFNLKPDTKDVVLHTPSKDIIKWLKREYELKGEHIDRSKVERLYRDYCTEIWTEMNGWNVEYKLIGPELPDWLLLRLGWVE